MNTTEYGHGVTVDHTAQVVHIDLGDGITNTFGNVDALADIANALRLAPRRETYNTDNDATFRAPGVAVYGALFDRADLHFDAQPVSLSQSKAKSLADAIDAAKMPLSG